MSGRSNPQMPRVGRYRLLGKLAAGGMAEVFLAEVAGPAGFQKTVVLYPTTAALPGATQKMIKDRLDVMAAEHQMCSDWARRAVGSFDAQVP